MEKHATLKTCLGSTYIKKLRKVQLFSNMSCLSCSDDGGEACDFQNIFGVDFNIYMMVKNLSRL